MSNAQSNKTVKTKRSLIYQFGNYRFEINVVINKWFVFRFNFWQCLLLFFKWAIPGLFLLIFAFSSVDSKYVHYRISLMTEFKPRTALPTEPQPLPLLFFLFVQSCLGLFFFIFVFSTQLIVHMQFLLMTRFKPQLTFAVRSTNCSTNRATTTG